MATAVLKFRPLLPRRPYLSLILHADQLVPVIITFIAESTQHPDYAV